MAPLSGLLRSAVVLGAVGLSTSVVVTGSEPEIVRREAPPIHRRETLSTKVKADYHESRGDPASDAEPFEHSQATEGAALGELGARSEVAVSLEGMLAKLVVASVTSAPDSNTGGVKEVDPEKKAAVAKNTETYEKVVGESERQAGLPDTVHTTSKPMDLDQTEEEEEAIPTIGLVAVLVGCCVGGMVWSQRKIDKVHMDATHGEDLTEEEKAAAEAAGEGFPEGEEAEEVDEDREQ